jgi:basic amino acid/polyamine antiporter, APA family
MALNPFRRKSIASFTENEGTHQHNLSRVLSLKDLTFFGIAAIIGAGSFSSLGEACFKGGPGVVILFIICGIACGFTAYCYAEFASRIPVAGSAYTYAYASFGEVFAWIIGWALLMEYSIGNIYVAFSWSDYFCGFLNRVGIHIPDFFTCSYIEAKHLANDIATGVTTVVKLNSTQAQVYNAWQTAPVFLGVKMIADIPAFVINILITYLVFRGVKESRNFSNVMVILKLCVVLLVICVGAAYINIDNWTPINDAGTHAFMPNGFSGVMMAVSGVFFAYIGFDAVSVLAEESKDPQRDLPKGMLYSLIICTVVYILLALVLTGVVNYREFEGVGDPLAKIFEVKNIGWMQMLVSICAVIAMTSVLLVFQMGQPRIWMSMSRDGLLPPVFQKIHPRFKTPSFSTFLTGAIVGIPLFFTDKSFVLDFTSIGTLFAFVLVCGGVLFLPKREKEKGKFHLPYINSRFIFPIILLIAAIILYFKAPQYFSNLLIWQGDAAAYNLSSLILWLILLALAIATFFKQFSLIPLMGLSTCLYLLTGMTINNWKWFAIWFALGLIVYYAYGYWHSKLGATATKNKTMVIAIVCLCAIVLFKLIANVVS